MPNLVSRFLDHTDNSVGLVAAPGEAKLMTRTKAFIRQHPDHAYLFVDCASFVIMAVRGILEAATTDEHFAGATVLVQRECPILAFG